MRTNLRTPMLASMGVGSAAALGWSLWNRKQRMHPGPRSYKVIAQEEGFEVRTYAPTVVILTDVSCPYDEAVTAGFRRLCHYLNGENTTGAQFTLQSPTFQERLPVKESRWRVTFTLREHIPFYELPKPLDRRIELIPLGIRTCAAHPFENEGAVTEERIEAQEQLLVDKIHRSTWKVTGGEPVLAEYQRTFGIHTIKRHELLIAVGR